MRWFTLVLDPEGKGIPEAVCQEYEAAGQRHALEVNWEHHDHAAVLTAWDDVHGDALVAHEDDWIAAGTVRLDNRAELEARVDNQCRWLTDLELVLRLIARQGAGCVSRILGDFGFIVWNTRTRMGVAARDAFGVRPLYYASTGGLLAWASRAEALASGDQYEPRYLIGLLTTYTAPPGLSVYAGVQTLPPASLAVLEENRVSARAYWSAADVELEPAWEANQPEAIATCRRLLIESVRLCLGGPGPIWTQLSGGLDSSSVTSLAGWLFERGEAASPLAGTVTYVDRQGTQTDERQYSDAVVRRYGLHNVAIVDPPMWYDEEFPPIAPDQPGLDFHVQPREQRLRHAVREAGGRVLLTGYGGDELFASNLLFLADSAAEGRVLQAVRETACWAAADRTSFWQLAWRNGLVPLLPPWLQAHLAADESPPGSWLNWRAIKRYGSVSRRAHLSRAPRGRKHRDDIVSVMQSLQGVVHGGILADALEVRHPLLYRPLVEFALSLPRSLRSRPRVRRWLLREAMSGILPDVVRARWGKPDTSDVLVRSLRGDSDPIRALFQAPILAELGLIDPVKFESAFEAATRAPTALLALHTSLFPTLAIEAWLQIRSGRWPHQGHLSSNRRMYCPSSDEFETASTQQS